MTLADITVFVRKRALLLASVTLAMVVAGAVWMIGDQSTNEIQPGLITVEPGPAAGHAGSVPEVAAPPPGAAADTVPDSPAFDALKRELIAEFPTLKNATISCATTCVLAAPLSTRDDVNVNQSQLPYMGRLEQAVERHGFTPIDALMIEETGDETVVLRLAFKAR